MVSAILLPCSYSLTRLAQVMMAKVDHDNCALAHEKLKPGPTLLCWNQTLLDLTVMDCVALMPNFTHCSKHNF